MFPRTFFDEMNEFRRAFDQAFENAFSPARRSGSTEWTFVPAVETGWTDDNLNLRVVVPGVTEQDLKLTVQGNQITIAGERKAPENFAKEGMAYNLMPYGKFERTLELPAGLDVDKLQARLHEGILDLQIPVAQAVKPKQIPIATGGETRKIAA